MQLPTRQQALRLYAQLKKPVAQAATASSSSQPGGRRRGTGDALIDELESHFFSRQNRLQHTNTPLSALPNPSLSKLAASRSAHPLRSASLSPRHLIGLDVGRRQVGLSLSDETLSFSTPLTTFIRTPSPSSLAVLASRFRQLCSEYEVAGVVVGLPLSAEGSLTAQCEEMAAFGQQLVAAAFPAAPPPQPPSVLYWDERYSTASSRHALQQAGLDVDRMKQRGVLDSAAACRILDGFMEWMGGVVQHERTRLREERRQQKKQAASAVKQQPAEERSRGGT